MRIRNTLLLVVSLLAAPSVVSVQAAELPGADPWSDELSAEVRAASAKTGEVGKSAPYTNRLILESSPYLRQHAHNPIDWYPWGDEAFAAARDQQKPIFLSIGYSTCHWCHTMREESFDDVEIATFINENYIAIKVDSEERPDIDRIYTAALIATTGRSGWPLNTWLTANLEPYYSTTYIPPFDGSRGVEQGFLTRLKILRQAWDEQGDKVEAMSSRVAESARLKLSPPQGGESTHEVAFNRAYQIYERSFDHEYGGRKMSPKFSGQLPIRFLLRQHRRNDGSMPLHMAELTLREMAKGGMYDQIGGGFHRYSTDPSWRVPHFEKMLYHNARIAIAYLEAYQLTGDKAFARIAQETLQFIDRDLSASSGGFFAAIDADSESSDGRNAEGWFYTWTSDELESALDADQLGRVKQYFVLNEGGDVNGRNVLYRDTWDEAQGEFDEIRNHLYRVRLERPSPFTDRKILTGWNALAISAFAKASLVFNDSRYLDSAKSAAKVVLGDRYENGRLSRTSIDGVSSGHAFADDYALMIQALLDLYQSSGEIDWLEDAFHLQSILDADFADTDGAYFYSPVDMDAPIAREKPTFDGSIPSANSIAVMNLLRFYELTTDDAYRVKAVAIVDFLNRAIARAPEATPDLLLALDFLTDETKAIIIVTPDSRDDAEPFLDILGTTFVPNYVLAVVAEGEQLQEQSELVPLMSHKYAIDGKATAYVCIHGICDLPTVQPDVFATQLQPASAAQ